MNVNLKEIKRNENSYWRKTIQMWNVLGKIWRDERKENNKLSWKTLTYMKIYLKFKLWKRKTIDEIFMKQNEEQQYSSNRDKEKVSAQQKQMKVFSQCTHSTIS